MCLVSDRLRRGCRAEALATLDPASFSKSYAALAQALPLMAHLSKAQQADLARALTKRRYEEGEVIIRQGDAIDAESCMFIIVEGKAHA